MLITEAIPYFLGRGKFGRERTGAGLPPPRNFKRNLAGEENRRRLSFQSYWGPEVFLWPDGAGTSVPTRGGDYFHSAISLKTVTTIAG